MRHCSRIQRGIALHAFSQFRHSSAQAFRCRSLGKASHALAQWSQAFAQHSAIVEESGPSPAQIREQAAQMFAQS